MIITKKYPLLMLLVMPLYILGQAPVNKWVSKAGGLGAEISYSIAIDKNNNSYITGSFSGTTDFGNSIYLTSSGSEDIFIAKYDSLGICQWAVKASGDSSDLGRGITVDTLGNVYVIGFFLSPNIDFGNSQVLSNYGSEDIFIAKYNNLGICLWAKKAGGNISDYGYGITIDKAGSIYITGDFSDTALFGGNTITSTDRDIFIAKYNDAGNCIWAKKAGGIWADHGNSIATDNNGALFITGYFEGTAHFDIDSLICNGQSDVFIARLDTSGNFQWVRGGGNVNDDYGKFVTIDTTLPFLALTPLNKIFYYIFLLNLFS